MNKRYKSLIGFLLGLPSLLLGLLMISYYASNSNSFILGIVIFILGFLGTLWVRAKTLLNLYLLFNSLVFIYLIGEGVCYLKQPYDSYTGFNKAGAKYDSQLGYRWVEDELRYFKFYDGEIIFDNQIKLNQQYKVVSFDYKSSKPDSIQRFMLFGDSFMEGIMLEENLPNRIYSLNEQQENQQFELYSFAMDGGGVMNWKATFFNETAADYEFDGIVLAIYMDNLYRDYMVMHLQNHKSFIGRIDTLVENFDERLFVKLGLQRQELVYTDEQIDSLKIKPEKSFDWPLKGAVYRLIKSKHKKSHRSAYIPEDISALQAKMGIRKWKALVSMIEYCKANDKSVVLASVPARQLLKKNKGIVNFHQADMQLIANYFNLTYFDGYEYFKEYDANQIDSLWLPHDGHWNQKGSNLFADKLFDCLNQEAQKLK